MQTNVLKPVYLLATALVMALACLVTAFPVWAEEPDSDPQAVSKLAELLSDYKTYQADFIQILVNENGQKAQENTGSLKAKRPGLFYWETDAPMTQFIVSDGEKVHVYDPDLEQVTIHSLDDRISTTPALLLSGEVDHLEETYNVRTRSHGEDGREFVLEPKNQDSLFLSLQLRFRDGVLQEMRLHDSLNQLSVLSFDHIRLNESIEDSAFVLDYPDTVDVIRDGA